MASTEVTTVADDGVVLHRGDVVERIGDLHPDTNYDFDGLSVRTLPRPEGELLCRLATANDVHFGETECGVIEGVDAGPILSTPPGETPYPVVMNSGAIAEIGALDSGQGPDAVVVKGDLTCDGREEEYQAFLDAYSGAFGARLHHVRGNHDAYHGQSYATGPLRVDLPGVTLAILDTVIPLHTTGQVTTEQLEWLDTLAAESDHPVLVFGHHHVWPVESSRRDPNYFGINPDDSDRLVEVVARRPRIAGYFAGHTHRNRVRRFGQTGSVPFAEVGCVKDFPGSWAEYRVFEGGVLQIHHRISTPEALAWSEQCRGIYGKLLDYVSYAMGDLADRCFAIDLR